MVSDSKIHKIVKTAKERARRGAVRPNLLTWCIRESLWLLYGHRTYY